MGLVVEMSKHGTLFSQIGDDSELDLLAIPFETTNLSDLYLKGTIKFRE